MSNLCFFKRPVPLILLNCHALHTFCPQCKVLANPLTACSTPSISPASCSCRGPASSFPGRRLCIYTPCYICFCSFLLQIGWSGFTGVGYPKLVPTVRFHSTFFYIIQYRVQAIADHIESHNLQSEPSTKKKFNLFVGASVGPEVEDRWARLDMIARRYPHQVGKEIARGINAGRINFADKHLSSLSFFLFLMFLTTVV